MNEDIPEIWRMRKSIFVSFDFFYEKIMDFIISIMNLRADKLCAPYRKRVGVFGPYPNSGEEIILEIAKTISNAGYGVISGLGFLEPGKPEELHGLDKLLLPRATQAKEFFDIPDYIIYRHLPRVTCKAVHHLTTVRGQRNEAEGCFSHQIPMLGFIINEKVENLGKQKRICNYLIERGLYWECYAPGKGFCFYPSTRPFCPFYNYVNIPWDIKQLFLHPMNRLISCNSLENVESAVKECLKTKLKKPTA